MIKSLLIDLDDTLLDSNLGTFLPAYYDKLAHHLADVAPRDRLIGCLIETVESLNDNLDPTRTLKDTFDTLFYPALGVTEAALKDRVDDFYISQFPTLRDLTHQRAEAAAFISAIRDSNFELVLATSPLFPRSAITQRLDWSGVPAKPDDFALITSYETAHFAKPNPEYFAEILGKLGRACAEAVMIGDNPETDLAPAALLGMQAFHVTPTANGSFPGGPLSAASAWLRKEKTGDDFGEERPATPRQVLARLRGYLAALLSMIDGMTAEDWGKSPSTSEWAPVEIVCHLRDVELEVNHVRVGQILTQPSPFLPAADPDQWAVPRRYIDQDPGEAASQFSQARMQTIAQLAALDDDMWNLPARHALFGPTTLTEVVSLATDHDLVHLAQLRSSLSAS